MAIQIFPTPGATSAAVAFTVPTAFTTYEAPSNLESGIYSVTTAPATSQAIVQFDDGTTITSVTTVSGTISLSLANRVSTVFMETTSGTDVIVTITKTAGALSGTSLSGTLDTLTTSGNYNQTGQLYVMAVGGGGGGGAGKTGDRGQFTQGGGGGSGGVVAKILTANGTTAYEIGSAGASANTTEATGGAGGTTNFGNTITIAGGNAGGSGEGGSGGNSGPGGGNGGITQTNTLPAESTVKKTSITAGTTGGGGQGAASNHPETRSGAGSGIGTGGTGGARPGGSGAAATGYGAGGGGAASNYNAVAPFGSGGAGTAGVIYVLRGF